MLAGALILSAKRKRLHSLSHVLVPYLVPLAAASIGVVVARPRPRHRAHPRRDRRRRALRRRHPAALVRVRRNPVRRDRHRVRRSPARTAWARFDVWLGRDTNEFGAARQPIHGRYALADGGWFGLGLGASREKWGLLSEPHNDFIFAIIGEELGLPGTIAVLAALRRPGPGLLPPGARAPTTSSSASRPPAS